jgi:hypothetical protein
MLSKDARQIVTLNRVYMHLHTPLANLTGEDNLSAARDARTYSRAMLLKGEPKSAEASAFVTWIVDEVISPFQKSQGQLRPTMIPKYLAATGAFLADLFRAANEGRWSKVATHSKHLVTVPGGKGAFGTMRLALGAAEYLEELPGYFRDYEEFGHARRKEARTSFRPTARLLHVAEERGVRLNDFAAHFTLGKVVPPVPEEVLQLTARKPQDGGKPKRLPFPEDDLRAQPIIAAMQRLNAHLMAEGRIAGIAFAGLRRSFNDADQPGTAYDKHGRFYSMASADHYERLEGGEATRQRLVRIDGKPAREVDIGGSHLTILHGLLGVPFDPSCDPYGIPGIDRVRVKKWLTIYLGSCGKANGGNPFKAVKEAGLARYPFLRDLPTLGIGPLDLQYHEAEILRLAMEDLMGQGLGFLPVHDALLVAQGNQEIAARAIQSAFHRYFTEHLGKQIAPVPILKWDE